MSHGLVSHIHFSLCFPLPSHCPVSEDCPAGYTAPVAKPKKTTSLDAMCLYTMRGSFPGTKLAELQAALKDHEMVKEKCLVKHS